MKPYKLLHEAKKEILKIPSIPNTFNFWHGGNLKDYSNSVAQKNGRYEYGSGLYLTTHYETAIKYAKGGRKLYLVTVSEGREIHKASIPYEDIVSFINTYVSKAKQKEVIKRIDGRTDAYIFNNVLLNSGALKSSMTTILKEFLISCGIDYELVHSPFGWGETMMVLYNTKKIVKVIEVNSKMEIPKFNLHEK